MYHKLFVLLASAFLMLTTSAGATEKYVVQNAAPVPGAPFLDVYAAERLGFFAEEDLDVEMRHSQNASQALQIAASGEADTARTTIEPYLSGYLQGIRGKFYMQNYDHNIFFFAVPEASDIASVEDLAGKKIGVVNIGAGGSEIFRSLLKMNGLPADNSVFLPVGVGPSALQALKNGSVAALALWDSAYSSYERRGVKLRYFQHPEIGQVGNAGFFISDESLAKRRGTHIAFLRALVKARLWISHNPDQAIQVYWDAVPGSQFGDTPEQQRANALKEITFLDPYPTDYTAKDHGRFDLSGLDTYLEIMADEGTGNGELNPADVVSNDLLDEIGDIDEEAVIATKYEPKN